MVLLNKQDVSTAASREEMLKKFGGKSLGFEETLRATYSEDKIGRVGVFECSIITGFGMKLVLT